MGFSRFSKQTENRRLSGSATIVVSVVASRLEDETAFYQEKNIFTNCLFVRFLTDLGYDATDPNCFYNFNYKENYTASE